MKVKLFEGKVRQQYDARRHRFTYATNDALRSLHLAFSSRRCVNVVIRASFDIHAYRIYIACTNKSLNTRRRKLLCFLCKILIFSFTISFVSNLSAAPQLQITMSVSMEQIDGTDNILVNGFAINYILYSVILGCFLWIFLWFMTGAIFVVRKRLRDKISRRVLVEILRCMNHFYLSYIKGGLDIS